MIAAELYWIASPAPGGKLAVAPHPRGREWLDDQIQSWKDAGIDAVACLLQDEELSNLGLAREEEVCTQQGLEFLRFPLPDRNVPADREAVDAFVDKIQRRLRRGKNVVIHCRAGIGRTGLIAACVLIREGVVADDAMKMISSARKFEIPDTSAQRDWIRNFS